MTKRIYTRIIGTGSYIPSRIIKNDYFKDYRFFDPATKAPFEKDNNEIISKFEEITNIKERRWIEEDKVTSDMAAEALKSAAESAGIDLETLDFIIAGTNFGDVHPGNVSCDLLPAVASKVKARMKIKNPACVAHDVIAGCPGWIQGMIIADAYIRSGLYKRGAVIGADVLSRLSDPHDRDSLIYADGAGVTIVEGVESDVPTGILSHSSRSDCDPYANLLTLGPSFNEELDKKNLYLKMSGHKLYVYALSFVPGVVKESIDKAGLQLTDIKKVIIHQANEKMDDAILKGVFKLYKEKDIPEGIMPMSIRKLGNSSAATVPTLLDLIVKGEMEGQEINKGDNIILCSVGAGMNINSIIYKW
ncbi:MAG: 3-oxoacyl-ACP synthase [Bacteroidetes bacterium GWF2_42_66]|nr:MAG: 3-oxoacyl-ACP synthase [Bacteroidetes bacterium GWA2_42_15]OFX97858.1 MAG: 3-oxoacyl-ACP synthase [Bacteroidetes bacterium GWE2_42_39]OFY44165.1 MAG: 3-oxoacyl-ACP synthase [Bacteroidetes bacterium GWF2_42_66]HBL74587.1 3-oxoacyl-ACP synthase [Prolixibacteraceae bacterium]HCR91527.1 3-oxoacyl-ACP synthase [Prolixibacteraceae bacterium]